MFTNLSTQEINLKIVFFGPQFSGEAETIRYIHNHVPPESKSELIELAQVDRDEVIFFDYAPPALGKINGFSVRFHLYALAGQIHYADSLTRILHNVDGVVFVADTAEDRVEADIMMLEQLRTGLKSMGVELSELPLIFQFNNRDAGNATSVSELKQALSHAFADVNARPCVESNSSTGAGVFDALKAIAKETLRGISDGRVKEPARLSKRG